METSDRIGIRPGLHELDSREVGVKRTSSKTTNLLRLAPLLASAALVCTIPFDMGGCSADPASIAGMVSAGGKVVHAASLSPRDEDDMGQAVAIAVTNQYGVYNDEKLNHYVNLVGMTVASASPRADLKFYFCVLDSEQVNAFSGPNGYVMITRGAIAHMRDESELAGVLAHEIGHVVKKHGLQAVQQAGFLDAGMTLAQTNDRVGQLGQMSDTIVDAVTKRGFSQPQEMEADHDGVSYVIAAGYAPDGYLHFLQRLQQARGRGGQNLMSTHPGLDDRISRVGDQIAKSGKAAQSASLADRFKKNVNLKAE